MDYSFIQLFNKDEDIFYSELLSGYSCWVLPPGTFIRAVKHISHLSDKKIPYYECILTNAVSWTLPASEMTPESMDIVKSMQLMSRMEVEAAIAVPYDEVLVAEQATLLEAYLDALANGDEIIDIPINIGVQPEPVVVQSSTAPPPLPTSPSPSFPPSSTYIDTTDYANNDDVQSQTGAIPPQYSPPPPLPPHSYETEIKLHRQQQQQEEMLVDEQQQILPAAAVPSGRKLSFGRTYGSSSQQQDEPSVKPRVPVNPNIGKKYSMTQSEMGDMEYENSRASTGVFGMGSPTDDSEHSEHNSDAEGGGGGSDSEPVVSRLSIGTAMKITALKTVDSMKKTVIKAGYMNKLAVVSGRNWKKRYFVLNPYHLAYYETDKAFTAKYKPKGEFSITADSVIEIKVVDRKQGFGLQFTNSWESMTFACSTENERKEWIQKIQSIIDYSKTYLRETLTLIKTVQKKSNFLSSSTKDVLEMTTKYFILSNGLLTCHPDHKTTSEIDGLINLNELTLIECWDEKYMITLTDSDAEHTKIGFQFTNHSINDAKQYLIWKDFIIKCCGTENVTFANDNDNNSRGSMSLSAAERPAPMNRARSNSGATLDNASVGSSRIVPPSAAPPPPPSSHSTGSSDPPKKNSFPIPPGVSAWLGNVSDDSDEDDQLRNKKPWGGVESSAGEIKQPGGPPPQPPAHALSRQSSQNSVLASASTAGSQTFIAPPVAAPPRPPTPPTLTFAEIAATIPPAPVAPPMRRMSSFQQSALLQPSVPVSQPPVRNASSTATNDSLNYTKTASNVVATSPSPSQQYESPLYSEYEVDDNGVVIEKTRSSVASKESVRDERASREQTLESGDEDGDDRKRPSEENPFDNSRWSLSGQSKDTGGVLLGKMFSETKNKPLVRVVFDNYSRSANNNNNSHGGRVVDCKGLHMICYDFGVFYSMSEIKQMIKSYSSGKSGSNKNVSAVTLRLEYDDFMVWWRSNERFSTLKLNDPKVKRRHEAAVIYKRYDVNFEGEVDMADFNAIHRELIEAKIIPKTSIFQEVIQDLGAGLTGAIEFNRFISWINTIEFSSSSPLATSTMKRIFGNLSRSNSENNSVASGASQKGKTLQRGESSERLSDAKSEKNESSKLKASSNYYAEEYSGPQIRPNDEFIRLGHERGPDVDYESDGISALTHSDIDGNSSPGSSHRHSGSKPYAFSNYDEVQETRQSAVHAPEPPNLSEMNAIEIMKWRKSQRMNPNYTSKQSNNTHIDVMSSPVPPPPPMTPSHKSVNRTSLDVELDRVVIGDSPDFGGFAGGGVFGMGGNDYSDDEDNEDVVKPAITTAAKKPMTLSEKVAAAKAAKSSTPSMGNAVVAAVGVQKAVRKFKSRAALVKAKSSIVPSTQNESFPTSSPGVSFLQDAVSESEDDESHMPTPVAPPAPVVVKSNNEFVNPLSRSRPVPAASTTAVTSAQYNTYEPPVTVSPSKPQPPPPSNNTYVPPQSTASENKPPPPSKAPPPPGPPLTRDQVKTRTANEANSQSQSQRTNTAASTSPSASFSPIRTRPMTALNTKPSVNHGENSLFPNTNLSQSIRSNVDFANDTLNAIGQTESRITHSSNVADELSHFQVSTAEGHLAAADREHTQLVTYQLLLKERNLIAKAMKDLQTAEELSLQRIANEEKASQSRIEEMRKQSLHEIAEAEKLLKQQVHDFSDKITSENAVLDRMRKQLERDKIISQRQNAQRLSDVTYLAKQLSEQHTVLMNERHKILTQRHRLEMTLQDINTVRNEINSGHHIERHKQHSQHSQEKKENFHNVNNSRQQIYSSHSNHIDLYSYRDGSHTDSSNDLHHLQQRDSSHSDASFPLHDLNQGRGSTSFHNYQHPLSQHQQEGNAYYTLGGSVGSGNSQVDSSEYNTYPINDDVSETASQASFKNRMLQSGHMNIYETLQRSSSPQSTKRSPKHSPQNNSNIVFNAKQMLTIQNMHDMYAQERAQISPSGGSRNRATSLGAKQNGPGMAKVTSLGDMMRKHRAEMSNSVFCSGRDVSPVSHANRAQQQRNLTENLLRRKSLAAEKKITTKPFR